VNLLAVIGNPVGHSLSPQIHQMFADQTGMSVTYQKVQAPLDGFEEASTKLLDQGARSYLIRAQWALISLSLLNLKHAI